MTSNEFQIDLGVLNRLSTVERSLDNFLYACRSMNVQIDSRYSITTELLERYMAAVRSRNKVRRNWHPDKALACDLQTLQWIAKDMFQSSLEKRLRKALVAKPDGKKVITEESILQIVHEAADELYKSNRKNSKPSDLESIVRRILKSNPDATDTDVINEMKSTPDKFGIIKIKYTYIR